MIRAGDADGAVQYAPREIIGMPAAAVAAMRATPGWAKRCALVHTWPREMREMNVLPRPEELSAITAPTLMMWGGVTTPDLRRSTSVIAGVLAASTLVEIPGQGHGAITFGPSSSRPRSWTSGRPEALNGELGVLDR